MGIVGLLLLCGSSIPVSYFIESIQKVDILKELADQGYLFKTATSENELNEIVFPLYLLIPLYNIIITSYNTIQYFNNKFTFFATLGITNQLDKMTKEEINEYKDNPTIGKAIYLQKKKDDDTVKKIQQDQVDNYKKQLREYYAVIYDKQLNEMIDEELEKEYKDIMSEINQVNQNDLASRDEIKIRYREEIKEDILNQIMFEAEKHDTNLKKMIKHQKMTNNSNK